MLCETVLRQPRRCALGLLCFAMRPLLIDALTLGCMLGAQSGLTLGLAGLVGSIGLSELRLHMRRCIGHSANSAHTIPDHAAVNLLGTIAAISDVA